MVRWHTTSPACAVCIRHWATGGCASTPTPAWWFRSRSPPPCRRPSAVPQLTSPAPHPAAQRSVALLKAARRAIADLLHADPAGVVLGADRAVLLASLADASSTRTGLGSEVVVSRLDDEANIAPWLRAADRFGATVKWAEVDIETGQLPIWQWEDLLTADTRLVAIPSASSTLGTLVDVARRHQAGSQGRRPARGRPLCCRTLPATRHRRDRGRRGRGQRRCVGRTPDRRTGVSQPGGDRHIRDRCRPIPMPAARPGWSWVCTSTVCLPAWSPAWITSPDSTRPPKGIDVNDSGSQWNPRGAILTGCSTTC